MSNWYGTANYVIEVLVFLVGAFGMKVFPWLQGVIATLDPTLFGIIGTSLTGIILLYFLRRK
ncbi:MULTISPECIES: hypothetical protein [Paenibacillus]|uniref:hypothetical protein n=1 Tax=Paenibacillus TaxID=44249 RepID=UPI0030DD299F